MEIYKDKQKEFNCDVKVEGAKLSDTKARLILEFDDGLTLLYTGKIDSKGNCSIVIPALKNLTESKKGNAVLEVIAESTVFEPWNSEFDVKQLKNVMVEMKETKPTEPKIKVITEIKSDDVMYGESITKALSELPKEKLKSIVKTSKKIKFNKAQRKIVDKLFEGKSEIYKKILGSIYFKMKK